jgi:hypothetical protein
VLHALCGARDNAEMASFNRFTWQA